MAEDGLSREGLAAKELWHVLLLARRLVRPALGAPTVAGHRPAPCHWPDNLTIPEYFERWDAIERAVSTARDLLLERGAASRGGAGTRGEPSIAQVNAVRDVWPRELPSPSDNELRALVRAANLAEWPDGGAGGTNE